MSAQSTAQSRTNYEHQPADHFLEAMHWRFATKEFSDKEVPQAEIDHLMEAIRLSPSSFNVQPWHIVVVRNKDLLKQLLPVSYNQPQVQTTNCLFVFCANTDFNDAFGKVLEDMKSEGTYSDSYEKAVRSTVGMMPKPMFTEYAQRQLYIALGVFLSAAALHKIDAGPMEGLDREGVRKVLGLPEHIIPFANVAIGYRKADPSRPKSRLKKEHVFDVRR